MFTKLFTLEKVLNFVTSIGAAIVVLGALMKITHRENADTFLTIGLVTEAIIFVIYAFIPPKYDINDGMKSLKEIMPKRTEVNEGCVINIETNQQIEKFNKNLADLNLTLEKIKSIFK